MPQYHFNVFDGFVRPDHKGQDLKDLKAARREAIKVAGGILEEDADRVSLDEVWYMEVTDDKGNVLFHLQFRVSEPERGPVPNNKRKKAEAASN